MRSPHPENMSKWPLHSEGRISITLTPSSRPSSDITLFKVELEILDGVLVTERSVFPKGQGIYFAETGALFVVLNPSTGISSFDNTLVLPNNVSYTTSQLWDLQVDPRKFPKNPFSSGTREMGKLNVSEIQVEAEIKKPQSFDLCAYIMVAQIEKKAQSGANGRIWKYGRSLPFESADDEFLVSGLDEERMIYRLSGHMASPNCGILVEIKNDTRSGDFDRLVSSGKVYIFWAIINLLCLSLLTIWHVESHNTNSMMMRVSAMAFLAPTCFDVVYSLFHLLLAFSYAPLSRPLYFIFFLSFALYTFYQVRYILDVCKLSWFQVSNTGNLARIYIIIYTYIGSTLIILIIFEYLSWIPLLFAHAGWMFQIVHNALNRTKSAFDWRYVIGSTVCRIFAPFYFYCLPQQLIRLPFRPTLLASIIIFDIFTIAILFAQDTFGPRFFIPKWLLPAAYNYHRPIPEEVLAQAAQGVPDGQNNAPICAICMTDVNPFNTEHMIAPCNHVFHEPCLLRWMDQKMECPVCRSRLPVPPELDQDESHHPSAPPAQLDIV
jgi:hypothetical protein